MAEDKIISDPEKMACLRWRIDGRAISNNKPPKAKCDNCLYREFSGDNSVCTNSKAHPTTKHYKSISEPDNMVCHKFWGQFEKIKNKYKKFSNNNKYTAEVLKCNVGDTVNEETVLPSCSLCNHFTNDKKCRLGIAANKLTDGSKIIYDIKGKIFK